MRAWVVATALAAGSGPAWAQEADEAEGASEDQGESQGAETSDLDALKAELEAMKAELAAQRAELAAQAEALAEQAGTLDKAADELTTQREGLAAVRLKQAGEGKLKWSVRGYYRARGFVFGAGNRGADGNGTIGGRLYEDQPTSAQYLNQRLRLGVTADYRGKANFNLDIQALDGAMWGDNESLARTSLFAGNPTNTGIEGTPVPNFEVLRAWTEFRIPIGQLRVGRMASHWGMGLLVNDGDGFRNDFGEANFTNQFDRILFATNPVAIAQAITKKKEKSTPPVFLAVAYDRLVQDPLVQYYGYRCSDGVSQESDRYDPRCDIDGDGVTDLDHSWTEDRDIEDRQSDWWADGRDDVHEMIFSLFYRGKDIRYLGGVGDLFAGFYAIHRWQEETESAVTILDGAIDASVHGAFLQFEGVGILGNTRAITLPNSENPDDPLLKTANIASYALRAGYGKQWWQVIFESGFASGDDQVGDELFTGRAMNPDYNVGLLLYEEVLKEITEQLWVGDASSLRSKGGVYNSHYLYPRVKFFPLDNTEIILAGVVAFPHKPDGAVIKCGEADVEAGAICTPIADASPILGWEVDMAIKHTFLEHILVTFETGVAQASNRLPLAETGLNEDGFFWTFQARAAWQF